MSMSIRFTKDEEKIIKRYADVYGISVSEVIRRSVMEKIEDELDLKIAEKAWSEYKANPISYTLEEIAEMIKDK